MHTPHATFSRKMDWVDRNSLEENRFDRIDDSNQAVHHNDLNPHPQTRVHTKVKESKLFAR